MVSCWTSLCSSVGPSVVCLSIFAFPDDNLRNVNRFSPNFVCALILWKSGLGLFMGKFCQFLTELSAHHTSIFFTELSSHYMSMFWFLDDNLNKNQWIFTKLGMCTDIMESCLGIGNGHILSIFDSVICPPHVGICISRQ